MIPLSQNGRRFPGFLVSALLLASLTLPQVSPAQQNANSNAPRQDPNSPPPTPEQKEINRLNDEGIAAAKKSDFAVALKIFQDTLEKSERIKYDKGIANSNMNIGSVYFSQKQFEKALEYLQRALKLYEKIGHEKGIANGLNNFGAVYTTTGQNEKALDYYLRALKLFEKLGDQKGIIIAINNIGDIYTALDQYEKALGFVKRALSLNEQAKNEQGAARSLNIIGTLYGSLGQFETALDFYQQAYKLYAKAGNAFNSAVCLNNAGGMYSSLGQFEKALDFYQQALKLYEQEGSDQGIANSFNNIGLVYYSVGQYEKALEFYQNAIKLYEKSGNEQKTAHSLMGIGNVYTSLNQYDKALDYHQRALKLQEKNPKEQDVALSLANLGVLYKKTDQYEKALEYLQRALKIFEKTGNPQDIGSSYNNIGNVYEMTGQHEKALEFHQKALKSDEKSGNLQDITASLKSIANTYATLKQYEKAEEFYIRAIDIFEKFSRGVLTDPAQLGDLLATNSLFQNYALLLTQTSRPEDALSLLERNRALGLSLQVGINQANLTRFFMPEEKTQIRTLKTQAVIAAKTFAAIKSRPAPNSLPEQSTYNTQYRVAEENNQKAVQQYELFRDALYSRHPQFRLVQGERARTFPEFKRLSTKHPDTLFLEFAFTTEQKLLALVLHNGVLTGKTLPLSKKQAAKLVEKWREAITAKSSEEPALALELYNTLLAPVLPEMQPATSYTSLVIVAEGALLDIPFAALIDKTGKRLIERYVVSNALSLGILLWQENPEPPTRDLLCVVDTRGDTPRPQVASLTRGGFGPLPASRKEGETIATLYPRHSTLLIGGQAQEAVVKKEMGKYAILHFASHGDLDTKNGLRSALVLAPEPEGSENDGFLDGREIVEIGVTAKLVVLSACESGLGKQSGGEGLMGLAWAFQAGGCPSVVASQWKVDDAATKDLMVMFYRGLKANKRKDDALRDAMLAVKKAKPQPYYWAAFQVIGKTEALGKN